MSWSLEEIQSQVSSVVDQTSTAPSNTSADYALRRTFINRALSDYAQTYDWSNLRREVNTRTSNLSSAVGGVATISMPTDFLKLISYPKISWSADQTNQFSEIDPQNRELYLDSDKFVYFLYSGPTATMIVHSSLVSGASIYFNYKASPGSLASPVDVPTIPDPTYLVQKTLFYYFQTTEDARFIEAGQSAELILQRMIENEAVRGVAYQEDRVKTTLEKRNFKIGRD